MNDDVVVSGAGGRETVAELRRSEALDALFERLDAGEVEMTGSQGGCYPRCSRKPWSAAWPLSFPSTWGMRRVRPAGRRARTRGTARRRRP